MSACKTNKNSWTEKKKLLQFSKGTNKIKQQMMSFMMCFSLNITTVQKDKGALVK